MKIICVYHHRVDHNKENQSSLAMLDPVVYLKPDSALLKDSRPFILPCALQTMSCEAHLVVKINHIGKSIVERFAHRYYSEITMGINFTDSSLLNQLRSEGLPWEMATAFDSSAAIGTFLPQTQEGRDQNLCLCLESTSRTIQHLMNTDMLCGVDKVISLASRRFTLKTGDLIFACNLFGSMEVAVGERLQGYIGNNKVLDFNIR